MSSPPGLITHSYSSVRGFLLGFPPSSLKPFSSWLPVTCWWIVPGAMFSPHGLYTSVVPDEVSSFKHSSRPLGRLRLCHCCIRSLLIFLRVCPRLLPRDTHFWEYRLSFIHRWPTAESFKPLCTPSFRPLTCHFHLAVWIPFLPHWECLLIFLFPNGAVPSPKPHTNARTPAKWPLLSFTLTAPALTQGPTKPGSQLLMRLPPSTGSFEVSLFTTAE